MPHITSKNIAYYHIMSLNMQHICVITIGRSFLIHLSAFWHSRGRICRPTAKFVAPIWTPNCPFGTADRHFVFSRLIFLLFAPGSRSLPPPTRPHSSWGRKSILFPDVGSSFFAAASALLFLAFFRIRIYSSRSVFSLSPFGLLCCGILGEYFSIFACKSRKARQICLLG